MGLLDRIRDPYVSRIETKLTPRQQGTVYAALSFYGAARQVTSKQLVKTFLTSLGGAVPTDAGDGVLGDVLVDEGLVAMLKASRLPKPGEMVLPFVGTIEFLVAVVGMFALVDRNHHLRWEGPQTLEGAHYSSNADVAQTQLIVRWSELLRLRDVDLGRRAALGPFLVNWRSSCDTIVGGFVIGISRRGLDGMRTKGRELVRALLPHQRPLFDYFIRTLENGPAPTG